jgi:hypothetical protein
LLRPDVFETVESVGEAILNPQVEVETLPPGVVDTLGPASPPRRGSWHDPCALCGKGFLRRDRILPVLLSDGSRPYVHVSCLQNSKPQVEVEGCPHGITPPSACTYCNGKTETLYIRSTVIRARAKGHCVVCPSPIVPGNLIAKVSSRRGTGWAHAWHLR